jgi:hypothetical protein
MTPRTFSILAILTALGIALAGYAVHNEPGYVETRGGDIVFPELNSRIDDVAKIVVQTNQRTMTMERGTQGWTLVESGGYLLQSKIVKGAILGFSGLTYVEAKTRQSTKYHKLELQGPEKNQSKGRGVKIYTQNGDLLIDTVIGRVRYNMPGTTRDGIYLRKARDPQTWLASGQLDVSRDPADWLEPSIMDIKSARIKSVVIRHPDGDVVKVSKTAPTDRRFLMANIPDSKQLNYDKDPDNIATVLEEFELADVKQSGGLQFEKDKTINARFETFDGLTIDIKMIKIDGTLSDDPDYWISLEANADVSSAVVRLEVEAINSHTRRWIYSIPGYKASRLNKRLSELLKDRQSDS